MVGTLTTQQGQGLTLAIHVKYTNHPENFDWLLSLAETAAQDPHIAILTSSTADRFNARVEVTAGFSSAIFTGSAGEQDRVWVAIVGVFTSNTSRDIYVDVIGDKGFNTTSRAMSTALDHITVGTSPTLAADFAGFLAEAAIWDVALSTEDITSYLNGECASGIDSSNLIGYYPLDTSNSTQTNEGVDASGNLTVTNATFAADHPIITCGATATFRRRQM